MRQGDPPWSTWAGTGTSWEPRSASPITKGTVVLEQRVRTEPVRFGWGRQD